MTSSETKTNPKNDAEPLIDVKSLTPSGSVDEADASMDSLSDSQLKQMLDRDTERAESKFGNAIENQKRRAKNAPQENFQPRAVTEYQYHTDRILYAVLIGLFVLTLVGWATYMLVSSSNSNADSSALLYESIAVPGAENATNQSAQPQASAPVESAPVVNEDSQNLPVESAPDDALTELEARVGGVEASKPVEPIATETAPQIPESAAPTALAGIKKPRFVAASEQAEPGAPVANAPAPNMSTSSTSTPSTPTPSTQVVSGDSSSDAVTIIEPMFVSRAHLAKGVESLEPVGLYESGQVSVEGRESFRLHFFTHFTGLSEQTVSHRWYFNDELVARVNMNIGSDSWRASSNKRISETTLGSWRVDAVNGQDQVIATQSFQVVP